MEAKEFSTRLRLPPMLADYIRNRGERMGQSLNEVIKYAIIQMMEVDRFDTAHGSPTVSKPTMTLLPVTAEVVQNDTAHEPPTVSNQDSLARTLSSELYSIKKDIVIISNNKLQETWDEFVQHRKELRKSLKPTQVAKMWKKFDAIIEKYGVDGLIECLNKSMENGWQGVFTTHLDDQQGHDNSPVTQFSMEDFA